jgi:predicted Rossmann fold flavoprotein
VCSSDLPDAGLRILDGNSVLASRRGSLLFAHFGLSGPVALDVSRVVSGAEQPEALTLEIDLLPALKESEIDEYLRREALASGKKLLVGILPEALPRRLGETLLVQAGLPLDRKAAGLTKSERGQLAQLMKRLRLPVKGTLGFQRAEVTAGGIALAEVDSRSMQSKLVPELFLAGEVLDLDGPIGGYNFQAAFSTGWLAGESV